MKATGIVRKMDNLGRIVLPMEIRKTFDINPGDPLEIYISDDGEIVFKTFKSKCVFCGSTQDVVTFKDKCVCKKCVKQLSK